MKHPPSLSRSEVDMPSLKRRQKGNLADAEIQPGHVGFGVNDPEPESGVILSGYSSSRRHVDPVLPETSISK